VNAVTRELDDPYAPTEPGSRPSAAGFVPGLSGKRIGVYDILEPVGSGGMGVVYRARDTELDRDVALKVLQPLLAEDAEFEARFVREARTAAKLDHPNVVHVFAAGRHERLLYIAMQFVKGRTLHELLRKNGKLEWREALGLVRQAALALGAAHQAGLVHRDVKPNNIMVDDAGGVKIMDFGLMRSKLGGEAITRNGDFFGTPEYASPEQCETAELDGRSDLYSLGAVLYELLSGRMPFKGDTPLALFKKILEEEPAPLRDVPAPVQGLVRRMMAKKPSGRFADAAELVAEIDRVLAGGRARRSPRLWIPVAAALAALALVLALVLLPKRPAAPEPAVAKDGRARIVVFDLVNGLPDAKTDWYSIALSDLLIASLGQHPSLEVPSRDTLLWTFGGTRHQGDADWTRLTHGMAASAYLTGKYYVKGGKVRVTLGGYRLPDNSAAFAPRTFEKAEDDIFALVDEISKSVAKEFEGAERPLARVKPCEELVLAVLEQGEARDERLAKPEPRLAEKKADAGKSLSGGAPAAPAAGFEGLGDRKAATLAPVGERERVQAWYQNRQALERCNFGKEDFEALQRGLKSQLRAAPLDAVAFKDGVEGFRRGLAEAQQHGQGKGGGAARVEFVCPACGAVAPDFGRCAPCGKYLILRVAVGVKKP
jgi:TolB-like protein